MSDETTTTAAPPAAPAPANPKEVALTREQSIAVGEALARRNEFLDQARTAAGAAHQRFNDTLLEALGLAEFPLPTFEILPAGTNRPKLVRFAERAPQ